MSAKLKNAGKLKRFVLSHIEKVVILLVLGVAGWLVYQTTGLEAEEREPSELKQLVSSTSNRIGEFSWTEALENEESPPLVAENFKPKIDEEINPGIYETSRRGWNPSPVPPVVFRKDPTLLSAESPRATGYTELMAFYSSSAARQRAIEQAAEDARRQLEQEQARGREDEQGSRVDDLSAEDPNRRQVQASIPRGGVSVSEEHEIKVQPCVIVTAKVPLEEQYRIYQNTFENALGYDPGRDLPQYLGYYVERAEVRGDDPPEFKPLAFRNGQGGPDLKVVSVRSLLSATADWAEEMEELADPNYLDPNLTFPLPPRVGSDWGPEVVHPDVPLAAETEAMEAMEQVEEPGAEAEGEDSPFSFGEPSSRGVRGRGFSGGGEFGEGRPTRRFGGELGGGFGSRSRRPASRSSTSRSRTMDEGGINRGAPHLMIRFVDFSAQMGRRYQYRFQLVLLDPNGANQTSGKYLEKEVRERVRQSKVPIVKTEWSDPTPVVSVPLAGAVHLAGVQSSSVGEPTASLVVSSFDIDPSGDAIKASIEKDKVRLGSVMNMIERDVEILVEGGRMLEKVERFTFRTGATLLDATGGDKISRDMTSPGEILVMDATGRLSVRKQIKDQPEVELHRAIYSEDSSGSGYGGGRGGGEFNFGEF